MASRDQELFAGLRRALLVQGPQGSTALARQLGIDQPRFSRLVARHREALVVTGRARATRYALRRAIPDVESPIPVFEVLEDGRTRELALLHPIEPRGFHVEARVSDLSSAAFDDLPYFLQDLRPAGFLGREVPRFHPELGLPPDLTRWSNDHHLRYLTRLGVSGPGALILGTTAFEAWMTSSPAPPISLDDRARRYPELAEAVLRGRPPGSSAAGEQPKFLATRAEPGEVRAGSPERVALGLATSGVVGPPRHTAVLVKFSPPVGERLGRRWADLLIAEHLALETLAAAGFRAARSSLVHGGERVFLEVERFDREGARGRRGQLSLTWLDAEWGSSGTSWVSSATAVARHVPAVADALDSIRWLQLFGHLIGNSDMHLGNLAFELCGTRVERLAPVYDMLPMLYAPQQGQLVPRTLTLPALERAFFLPWLPATEAATQLWSQVSRHPDISADFQAIAAENLGIMDEARALGERLPR